MHFSASQRLCVLAMYWPRTEYGRKTLRLSSGSEAGTRADHLQDRRDRTRLRRSRLQRGRICRLPFAARGEEGLCNRYRVWRARVEVEKRPARGGDGADQRHAREIARVGEARHYRRGLDEAEKHSSGGATNAAGRWNCNIADKAAIRGRR